VAKNTDCWKDSYPRLQGLIRGSTLLRLGCRGKQWDLLTGRHKL
jgi:hypothetical protein